MSRLVRVHKWQAENANLAEMRVLFQKVSFCSVDPGEHGACILQDACSTPWWGGGLYGGAGNMRVADMMCSRMPETRLVIAESQFSKKNPQTALSMSLQLGVLLGQIHACVGENLDVVMVAPSTWQAYQRKYKGVQLKRGEGIKLALEVAQEQIGAESWYQSLLPVDKGGAASAFGIHQWWHHVMGQ